MPKAVEDKLKREAAKKGLKGEAADRYVYGTMQKRGLMKRKGKGMMGGQARAIMARMMEE